MANSACRKTGYGNKITSNMVCAGYLEGMKDSCQVCLLFKCFSFIRL